MKMQRSAIIIGKTVGLLVVINANLAQATPPDAGQIFRQQEQIKPKIDRLPQPEEEKLERLGPLEQGVTIPVKSITISGGEGLESQEVLQDLVADAINQTLGFPQLQQLAERISQHLKAKGWLLAKAYLPKQDVTEGNIQINIIQGHLEQDEQGQSLQIERTPGTRLHEEVIQQHLRYVISGDNLNNDDLERALLLLNDLPGIHSRAELEKGKTPGGSRLGVKVREDALLQGNFSIDDFGNRYTGPWRGNLNLYLNDLSGMGDQLSIAGVGAENLGQGSAAYSIPIGPSGLRANAHYSYLDYSIGREFKQLDSNGVAQYTGGGLSYPFIRSRAFSLWGTADYTHKALRDNSLQQMISHKQIDNGSIGFTGRSLDRFNGGSLTQFAYTATVGSVDLSDVKADYDIDQATAHTQGVYDKHNFSLARLQKLTDNFSFYASAYGQFASKNLASAEKFILGGPNGVRAYPIGEAIGDSGWLANFELRYDLPFYTQYGNLQLIGFFDTGHITLHEKRWAYDVNSLSGRNEYSLSGSGIGINYTRDSRFAIRTTWSHTIGDNPGRSTYDLDSDGKRDDNRFWLQSIVYF